MEESHSPESASQPSSRWWWLPLLREHAAAIAFIAGFIWDNLTLTRIDLWFDQLVLFSYLSIAGMGIVLMNFTHGRAFESERLSRAAEWIPSIAQFSFGALFSGYLVYYSRSGSLLESWPFLLILAGLMVGNEVFKSRYASFVFHMSVFFVVLFTFLIFQLPIVFGTMGAHIFLLSGVLSLAVFGLFVYAVARIAPARVAGVRRPLIIAVGGIYLLFNALYFLNLIPPIPLSLKSMEIAHGVSRTPEGDYVLSLEERVWYQPWEWNNFHRASGEPVYAFSAVFAPTRLSIPIYHHWEYYDSRANRWVSAGRIEFPIEGGRDEGYRGYSLKSSVFPGQWRVSVETARGQVVGRERFQIEEVGEPVPLREKIQ